ncbi:hypothetical protein M0R45_025511 [Rubus argutus]|uniref:Uncharacterized protein n=1 Tax=Rubus argutus TaxID=59490 RepID=A0AAW1WUE7_RUBAR
MSCAEHKYCVRHLYNNFKNTGHNGLALKNSLWSAGMATTVPWSHFITNPKCDILLNNLCGAFNVAILDARDKPILSSLEKLRNNLMLRMTKQREIKWTQPVEPRIFGIIEAKRKKGGQCTIRHSENGEFEVKHIHGKQQFHVN